jgi:hypothetical protein
MASQKNWRREERALQQKDWVSSAGSQIPPDQIVSDITVASRELNKLIDIWCSSVLQSQRWRGKPA